jgi:hypothetical protein
MPENISDLSLEGLQGVDQHLINKIKGAGIHSIPDLAVTTSSELLEDYYSNYDDDNVYTLSGKINPEEPVICIKSRYEDPDIIVSLVVGGGDYSSTTITILDYLFSRTLKLGLDLYLGREKTVVVPTFLLKHPGVRWIEGRLSISNRRSLYRIV